MEPEGKKSLLEVLELCLKKGISCQLVARAALRGLRNDLEDEKVWSVLLALLREQSTVYYLGADIAKLILGSRSLKLRDELFYEISARGGKSDECRTQALFLKILAELDVPGTDLRLGSLLVGVDKDSCIFQPLLKAIKLRKEKFPSSTLAQEHIKALADTFASLRDSIDIALVAEIARLYRLKELASVFLVKLSCNEDPAGSLTKVLLSWEDKELVGRILELVENGLLTADASLKVLAESGLKQVLRTFTGILKEVQGASAEMLPVVRSLPIQKRISLLRKVIAESDDASIVYNAACQMTTITNTSAVRILAANFERIASSAQALGNEMQTIENFLKSPKWQKAALQGLFGLLKLGSCRHTRNFLARLCFQDSACCDFLLQKLSSSQQPRRGNIMEILASCGDRRIIPYLRRDLQSAEDEETKVRALALAARLQAEELTLPIMEFLADSSFRVRKKAAEFFLWVKVPEAGARLRLLLDDEEPEIVALAAEALASIRDKVALGRLYKLLTARNTFPALKEAVAMSIIALEDGDAEREE